MEPVIRRPRWVSPCRGASAGRWPLSTQFRGFRHFGVIGGVGILCCWAATFLILPAALAVLARHGLGNGRSPARLGGWLVALVPCRRPIVVGMTALVLVGSAAGAARYLASRPFETRRARGTGPPTGRRHAAVY